MEAVAGAKDGASELGTWATCRFVKFGSANEILETARNIFYRVSDAVVKNLGFQVTKCTLKVMLRA